MGSYDGAQKQKDTCAAGSEETMWKHCQRQKICREERERGKRDRGKREREKKGHFEVRGKSSHILSC